jgi:polysaccharide biosynthesis protein PslH
MTVFFMTDISVFPVSGGEKIRSYGLLKILSSSFDRVIAIIGKSDKSDARKGLMQNVEFHEFDFQAAIPVNKIKQHLGKFRKDLNLINKIENLLTSNPVQVAFIDYHYYGQYINFFKNKGIPVIYGTHNVQSQLVYQLPAVSIKNRISIMLEYLVDYLHEKHYLRRADALITVSEPDRSYYKKYIPGRKIFVIPNFLVDEEYSGPFTQKKDYIIMTANFLAYQNEIGLIWFLDQVWNDPFFKNEKLLLAGIGSDHVLEKIFPDRKFPNIQALGSVDDLKPLIAEARVAVVPILHGSGTRLKCIEAMALKTQLLSTSRGAEGIEHENSIIIADTADSFRSELKEIIRKKTGHTEKAWQIFKNKYSLQPNRDIFKNVLKLVSH